MLERLRHSRAAKRFFRSRLAAGSLAVVGIYFAIVVMLFLFGAQAGDFNQPIDSPYQPGFLSIPNADQRLDVCNDRLKSIEIALGSSVPEAAMKELRWGRVQVAEMSPEKANELIQQGWKQYDKLSELPSDFEIEKNPAEKAELEALEQTVDSLLDHPKGYDAWMRSFALCLGTDKQGYSICWRAIYSIKVAVQIGAVTALVSLLLGGFLGAAAGYLGGWVDHFVTWLYTTLSSVPNLVLLMLLAFVFSNSPLRYQFPLLPIYAAFCLTFWIGPCRLIRGEAMKIKELDYIQAARSFGASRWYILRRHIIPSTTHLLLISFSLLFIGAVKSEVILSYLGLGVKDEPSWGVMIGEAKHELVNGFFWQVGSATAFMFGLVLAFNILTDALQDAFDPKHQSG